MSARTEHRLAHVLRWIADGMDIQARCGFGEHGITEWQTTAPDALLCYLAASERLIGRWEFRLAPPATTPLVFLPAFTTFFGH